MNALKMFRNVLAFAIIAFGLQASLASAQSVSLNYSNPAMDNSGYPSAGSGSLDVGSQLNLAPGYTANFTDGSVTFDFTAASNLPPPFFPYGGTTYSFDGASQDHPGFNLVNVYRYYVEYNQGAQVTVGASSITSSAPQSVVNYPLAVSDFDYANGIQFNYFNTLVYSQGSFSATLTLDPTALATLSTTGLLPFQVAFTTGEITLDSVSFNGDYTATAAVPEPETYAMMLAGLGMLGFAARRRKQKAA